MAMTVDGKIATANRQVHSFGSSYDQRHLLELRTDADAILCGATTLNSASISLDSGGPQYEKIRLRKGRKAYAIRIIASGSGSIDPNAEIFKHHFSPIILLSTSRMSSAKIRRISSLVDDVKIFGEDEIQFPHVMEWLVNEWQVKSLLCEGGGELNEALFRHRLVDELHLTICPYLFGGRRSPTIADGVGISHLSEAFQMSLASIKRKGNELFLIYHKQGENAIPNNKASNSTKV